MARSRRDDDAAGVGAAADGVGEADARGARTTGTALPGGDLACARLTAKLVHELDHLTERGRAQRLALREQPAARVHRYRRLRQELGLLAGRAQQQLLVREQLSGRIGVLALD